MARKKNSNYRHNKPANSLIESNQGDFNFGYHQTILGTGTGGEVNTVEPNGNFGNSVGKTCRGGRLGASELIRVSQSVLIDTAIEKISNTVSRMAWGIKPPDDVPENVGLIIAKSISRSLSKPNFADSTSYYLFAKAVIKNLLIFNVAPIQRAIGLDGERPFWLWAESPQYFVRNPAFRPEISGITPKFYFRPGNTHDRTKWVPLMQENLFLVKSRVATYDPNPPSAVELAYQYINDWLGLGGFQRRSTSKAIRDYMISLEQQVSDAQMNTIRTWWQNDVQGSGEIPIFGGKIQVHKFGAKSDSDLFLNFKDHIAGIVAMCFGLHQKDFNVEQKSGDNRATANVTADQSFQHGMLPLADCFASFINSEVIDFYCPGYSFFLSDREPRGEEAEQQSAALLFEKGMVTRNESRMMVGLEPIPGGDVFVDGTRVGEKKEKENDDALNKS